MRGARQAAGEPQPRVWVLLAQGVGGNGQLSSLADALGWPYETKRVSYNPLQVIPNLLTGASGITIDRRRSDPLGPPWPDLVLAASRRSAPVARWIRARSGGRTRLVHLLHTMTPLEHFDLVVTLPQYRLPPAPNVLEVTGALNRIDPHRLAAARVEWKARFEHLPRPWIGLLVGGDSSSYHFDPAIAARLGREASEVARAAGGALLVSTSPRTAPDAETALFEALDCPHYAYRFRLDDAANPYTGILAVADRFVVTIDSASLPMEAASTGKPVEIFAWDRRGGGRAPAPLRGWRARAHRLGVIKPARDFDAYAQALCDRGLATPLGAAGIAPSESSSTPADELSGVVERVRALVREPAASRRVVFVVGAGRSGTSALMRGVQALGVDLGDHLKRPTRKNPTGFFEDRVLVRLAKRVRQRVGLVASSVTLLDDDDWTQPELAPLRAEARGVLEARVAPTGLFGFKYGQTLRLLPFWLDICREARVDPAFVFALRNPLSVARSRAKLDGQRGMQEKSDLEWLVNVVPYFRQMAAHPFVVVDYDLLMDHPNDELERVARGLDLPLDDVTRARMSDYAAGFLADGMRHTRFDEQDLSEGVNPLARDAYHWLRRLAADEVAPDAPDLWAAWDSIERRLIELAPLLRYVDAADQRLWRWPPLAHWIRPPHRRR